MAELLNQLEAQIPNVRDVMLAAIGNVRVTHLLDKALLDRLGNEEGSAPNQTPLPLWEALWMRWVI